VTETDSGANLTLITDNDVTAEPNAEITFVNQRKTTGELAIRKSVNGEYDYLLIFVFPSTMIESLLCHDATHSRRAGGKPKV